MALGGKTRTSGQGRPKGAINKATAKRQAEVEASGLTPLDYMLAVMRDEQQPAARRDDMAKAVAPYVHPKLAAVTHKGDENEPIRVAVVERRIVDAHD